MKTDVKNKTEKTLSICKVLSHQFGVGNSKFRVGTSKPISVDVVPFGIYKKSTYLNLLDIIMKDLNAIKIWNYLKE
ncbi:MAG: hypothetical protein MZV64_36665 [Ignavibacteriales bacterium]|nr:hypothetical protein [Ignavibacteriales bacterium]